MAEKKPAVNQEGLALNANDSAASNERGIRESKADPQRTTTAYRISDSQVPYSSGADLETGGRITFQLDGTPERGEQGTLRAASHVVERLNSEGGRWGAIEAAAHDARQERGVDVIAHGPDGATLEMQVTRAERGIWKELDDENVVRGSLSVDEAAEALWLAIDEKRTRADPVIVLVLDAANMGQFAFDPVLRRFRQLWGTDAANAGFSQVWLAGPTAESTARLDRPA